MARQPRSEPDAKHHHSRAATREAERRISEGAGREELAARLRQSAMLCDFGRLALECRDLDAILQRACELSAEGMHTRFAKVLEWRPAENAFLVRAGVGWRPGVVGHAILGANMESPAGYAFHTGEPVISNDLSAENRFRTPRMMREHGVRRAMNVLLTVGEARPFGVLEVDSTEDGRFEQADLDFLQNFANLLGVAIEREKAEAELAESRERFRLVTQATTDVIWDWDLASDAVTWSDAMLALVGEAPGAVVPTLAWWTERVHPDDRPRVLASLHAAAANGETRWREEYRFRRADGDYADVVDQGFLLRNEAGEAVRMIGGMLDVTEIKKVEAALRETQGRLKAALDAAEMGALDFDPQSGELHLDERCRLLLGLPADAPMDYARLMESVGPEAREAIESAVVKALDPTGPGDFFIEIAVMSPQDGEKHWIAARGRVLNGGRESRRVVGIAFDLTYRKKAEQMMAEALEHQAMLVREVSHRVKNSLQLVAGVLALQARSAAHEEVRQALTVAQTRLQTIGQVHDQLWRQPDMQEVELAGFLRSLCDKLQESAAGHMVNFVGQPVTISADRAIPVALLVNELVTNALKYAYPEGGGPVDVELAVDGERVTLEVCDHGVGLPPQPEAGADGRESLGMRIVTGLVRQLRAEMETGSNDPGARFLLRFDRTEPEAEPALL